MTTIYDDVEKLTHGLIDDLRTCCGIFWNMTRSNQHRFGRIGVHVVITCLACVAHGDATHRTPSWRVGF